MNNNSTLVPEMEQSLTSGGFNPYISGQQHSGTIVPGMHSESPVAEEPQKQNNNGAPIVGFLYSVSRAGNTEFWPIHLGANVIGRGEDVDICLSEATVSTRHAQLNVKQMRTSHRLIANIQDIGSKCGMFLNDEELDYETHPCKNGDVVTIGEAYKLLIVLIDTDALGLGAASNFIPVKVEKEESPEIPSFAQDVNINPYDRNNNGTVDFNGINSIPSGGTMIIE